MVKEDSKDSEINEKNIHPVSEDDSDDDFGPQLPPQASEQVTNKKRKVLQHENLLVNQLPNSEMYERSYMHREVINAIKISKTNFIVTTSIDGSLKFWKKISENIEFVKHYKAHLGLINDVQFSHDGLSLATCSIDKTIKVFDVINFDMTNLIRLDFTPSTLCWIVQKGQLNPLIACADQDSKNIYIFDSRGDGEPIAVLDKIHSHPVNCMVYNHIYKCVISSDKSGMIEYWDPNEPHDLPPSVEFERKFQTDLYEFKKKKVVPTSITLSPDCQLFVVVSNEDRQLRVFKFTTGKLIKTYDESLDVYRDLQQAGSEKYKLEDMEFGRRLAAEREWVKSSQASSFNAVFDQSSNFLIYTSMLGIKIINLVTNKMVKLLGKSEPQRFLNVAIYQGAPKKKGNITLEMAASDNPLYKESEALDPTIFVTSFRKNRFFMFTQREPGSTDSNKGDRDIFNEKPTREEQTIASNTTQKTLANSASIHTTMGDIHVQLFPQIAPKAVENFVTHSKNGYYNGVIFHRVIKSFMIQTGDPLGDGTGGESIWGEDFEDEIHRDYRHDRPYTLSMANAGPCTNGSQFFITTTATPWLDNKHTIFGRVTSGMDVVHGIEGVKTDRSDKPVEEITIINIDVK